MFLIMKLMLLYFYIAVSTLPRGVQYCALPLTKERVEFSDSQLFVCYLRNRKHVPCFYRVLQYNNPSHSRILIGSRRFSNEDTKESF